MGRLLYGCYEHAPNLDYKIVLDKSNSYYDTFVGSDVENTTVDFQTDSMGYIMPSYLSEKSGKQIFFLGDSTIESTFVQPKKRYPYLVGEILHRSGRVVNTYNAGISGADTLSLIKVFINKILRQHPEIIVISNLKSEIVALASLREDALWSGINMEKNGVFFSDEIYSEPFAKRLKTAVGIVFPKIGYRYTIPIVKQNHEIEIDKKKDIISLLEKDYSIFIDLCKSRKIEIVMLTQATRYYDREQRIKEIYEKREKEKTNIEFDDFIEIFRYGNQVIRNICKKKDIECINLEKLIEPNLLYDEVHYSNAGSLQAAKIISTYFEKRGIAV